MVRHQYYPLCLTQGGAGHGIDSFLVTSGDCSSASSNSSGVIVSSEALPTARLTVGKFDAVSVVPLSDGEMCFCQSICEFLFGKSTSVLACGSCSFVSCMAAFLISNSNYI